MSGGLGNIFDATCGAESGPRGPDIKVVIEVPRGALGDAAGFAAPVPTSTEIDGCEVKRRVGPGEEDGRVRLHLPSDFSDGATLRLRGQGGEPGLEGGRAGDLYVTVRLVESPSAQFPWIPWAAAALLLGGGGLWFALGG